MTLYMGLDADVLVYETGPRTLQNYTARHCTREKSKRKTEEKMGGQHTRMDGYGAGKDNERGRGQRGMEENDCKIFCGAPTVTPTAGYVRKTKQNVYWNQTISKGKIKKYIYNIKT